MKILFVAACASGRALPRLRLERGSGTITLMGDRHRVYPTRIPMGRIALPAANVRLPDLPAAADDDLPPEL